MKAAHERSQAATLLKLLPVIHTAKPEAVRQKLLEEINPRAVESPFDRLLRQARADAAARKRG